MLARKTDINNPKGTETLILNLNCEAKYKNSLLSLYQHFCKSNQIKWEKPKKISENAPPIKIPTEDRINVIISSATSKYAVVYNLSKHGLRPDEISKITLRDLDLDRGELTVRTSKLGLERTLQLKKETLDMLKEHTAKCGMTELNQRLFSNADKITEHWAKFRRIAYEKFKDPELLKIRLYDLRHWYATMTYLKTRDIFYVKYVLGHRNIQSTLIYMHIAKGLMNYSEDYICKVASNVEDGTKLIEAGFEYVTTYEGKMLFRKRK